MKSIEIFYQGENLAEVQSLEVDASARCEEVKAQLATKHGISADELLLFQEDSDEILADSLAIGSLECSPVLKLHYNRCRAIEVTVAYQDALAKREFAPSTTVGQLRSVFAETEFKMTSDDSGEHVLKLSGAGQSPKLGMHIGALVTSGCAVRFDLVPESRVQGSTGASDIDAPDHRAWRADIAKATFRLGEKERRWRLERANWPISLISVSARDGREFTLRFDCTGYPEALPTCGPWDLDRDAPLDPSQWPRSRTNTRRVSAVFNPRWNTAALYLPCDRTAIPEHSGWYNALPSMIWRPGDGIVQYLEIVHELLNCPDYAPTDRAKC